MKLSKRRLDTMSSHAPEGDLEVALVQLLMSVGFQHKRIAALFDCNQGRIAEISAMSKLPGGLVWEFRVGGD